MKYYLSLLLCLFFTLSWAQKEDLVLQNYAKQMNSGETLRSNFVEEKHLSLLDQPIRSEGIFLFNKNTQKLRWQYQKPFENGFLIGYILTVLRQFQQGNGIPQVGTEGLSNSCR